MKNVISLYKLRMMMVLRSSVLVVPTIALVAFLGIMYSFPPVQVTGSFLISGIFLFVICAYVSMSIQFKENDVHEEIFLLHSDSEIGYYISRELIIGSITLVYSIVLSVYPLIKLAMRPNLFSRNLEAKDVVWGSIIILGNGILGAALGDLFHHRIFTRKRDGLTGLIFVTVVAMCKLPLTKKFPFFRIIGLILPPVSDGLEMVGDTDVFSPKGTVFILLHTIVFVAVVIFVKIRLLMRNKYSC